MLSTRKIKALGIILLLAFFIIAGIPLAKFEATRFMAKAEGKVSLISETSSTAINSHTGNERYKVYVYMITYEANGKTYSLEKETAYLIEEKNLDIYYFPSACQITVIDPARPDAAQIVIMSISLILIIVLACGLGKKNINT